jgi:hypothetical protein
MTVGPMSPGAGRAKVHAEEAPQFLRRYRSDGWFSRTASMASASAIQASCQAFAIQKSYILQMLEERRSIISDPAHRMEKLRFAQLLCGAQ